ncbi:hypothetical protein EPR50_G00111840 [Perca flavescens]|uniref:Uncharacterized protein n=1 Tax=Perca flavescens TaxID=8167 RepID=A0A484CYB6_PERFV|nr:hypothetical protein EPR50_G00111840 [Perca flavescens]
MQLHSTAGHRGEASWRAYTSTPPPPPPSNNKFGIQACHNSSLVSVYPPPKSPQAQQQASPVRESPETPPSDATTAPGSNRAHSRRLPEDPTPPPRPLTAESERQKLPIQNSPILPPAPFPSRVQDVRLQRCKSRRPGDQM